MFSFRSLFVHPTTIHTDLTRPKLITAAICIVALFSVDLTYGYHPIPPYAFCAGNPIKYVDPDGQDVWEINQNGQIVNRIEDKTQDAFHIVQQVDGNWQRIEGQSITFEYGTITGVNKPTVNVMREDGSITNEQLPLFQVKGDDKATQFFEFMANPGETTNVEWSQVKVGTAESQKNIVGNMHQEGETAVGQYVFRTGYTVRENNHSHTNGITTPSLGDVTTAGMINETFPNAVTKIYTNPSQYSPFNKNSEYRIIGLPSITVWGRKPKIQ